VGKVWVLSGDAADGLRIEALGMRVMHTRQEHWKPTTNAVQRFGPHAIKNRIDLTDEEARRFVAGEDQEIDWDGDWGYLSATREVAGEREPLGVGLYTYGELKSTVSKGRRRELP
jgi:NOL1/NOP2/fmu family ribosome biogenesis protein